MTKKKFVDLENPLPDEVEIVNDVNPTPSLERGLLAHGETLINEYDKGFLFTDKTGIVKFRSNEDYDREIKSREWEEPEPAPQLTPFEQLALPGVPTKHHL